MLFFLTFLIGISQPPLTFSIYHRFYRDQRTTEVSLRTINPEWSLELGSGERDDWYLNQLRKTLLFKLSFKSKNSIGTLSIGLDGSGFRERRELFQTGEREGGLWLHLKTRSFRNLFLSQRTGFVATNYLREGEELSNAGISWKTDLLGKVGRSKAILSFGVQLREITREREISLKETLTLGKLDLTGFFEDRWESYPLSEKTEGERKRAFGFALRGRPLDEGLSLSLWGSGKSMDYQLEKTRVAREMAGGGLITAKRNLGRLSLLLSYQESGSFTDYRWATVDEELRERSLQGLMDYSFKSGEKLRLTVNMSLRRYDFPEEEVPDARDERVLESSLSALFPRNSFNLSCELRIKRWDLVYLDRLRSADTRKTDKYRLLVTLTPTKFSASFKWEIASFYSIFRFRPENNILLRYLEMESRSAIFDPLSFLLRIRLQDQGRFRKTIAGKWRYYATRRSRELWTDFNLRIIKIYGHLLALEEAFYVRLQGPIGGKMEYSMWEMNHGFKIEGGSLTLYLGIVTRKGEGTFPSIRAQFERKI
jgi:hypothetical protein